MFPMFFQNSMGVRKSKCDVFSDTAQRWVCPPINDEHVHVLMCKFTILKKLLLRFHYNINHKKGASKFLCQWVPKLNVEPSPKRRHANTLDDVSIIAMS
jgi:hypothetical protein